MPKIVREPIQVYLTPEERAELDRKARALGVSRSELLRRGISAVGQPLRSLVNEGALVPPTIQPGTPPPSAPVAPLDDLMRELDEDRHDR